MTKQSKPKISATPEQKRNLLKAVDAAVTAKLARDEADEAWKLAEADLIAASKALVDTGEVVPGVRLATTLNIEIGDEDKALTAVLKPENRFIAADGLSVKPEAVPVLLGLIEAFSIIQQLNPDLLNVHPSLRMLAGLTPAFELNKTGYKRLIRQGTVQGLPHDEAGTELKTSLTLRPDAIPADLSAFIATIDDSQPVADEAPVEQAAPIDDEIPF